MIASVGVIGIALGSWLSGNNLLNYFDSTKAQSENLIITQTEPATTTPLAKVEVHTENTSSAIDIVSAAVEIIESENRISEPEVILGPKVQSLSDIFALNTAETNADYAINRLLNLWDKAPFESTKNLCVRIKSINLRCLYRNSSWLDMLRHKRPVILELYDSDNVIHHVVVNGVDEKNVRMIFNEKEVFVPLSEITTAWRGVYLMFWQPDKEYLRDSLQYDISGNDVLWLKEKLQSLNVKPGTLMTDPYFGANTKRQVQAFQRQSRLLADGVVGSETYLAINNALGLVDSPILGTEFEGRD